MSGTIFGSSCPYARSPACSIYLTSLRDERLSSVREAVRELLQDRLLPLVKQTVRSMRDQQRPVQIGDRFLVTIACGERKAETLKRHQRVPARSSLRALHDRERFFE